MLNDLVQGDDVSLRGFEQRDDGLGALQLLLHPQLQHLGPAPFGAVELRPPFGRHGALTNRSAAASTLRLVDERDRVGHVQSTESEWPICPNTRERGQKRGVSVVCTRRARCTALQHQQQQQQQQANEPKPQWLDQLKSDPGVGLDKFKNFARKKQGLLALPRPGFDTSQSSNTHCF